MKWIYDIVLFAPRAFGILAAVLVTVGGVELMNHKPVKAYFITAAILAIAAVGFVLLTFFGLTSTIQ